MKVRAYRARGFAGLGYLRAARERRGEHVGFDHRLMLGRLIVIGQTGIVEPLEPRPRRRRFPAPPAPDAYKGFRDDVDWQAAAAAGLEARARHSVGIVPSPDPEEIVLVPRD